MKKKVKIILSIIILIFVTYVIAFTEEEGYFGLTVQTYTNRRILNRLGYSGGVLVYEVKKGRLADQMGIRPNDIIVSVNNMDVKSANEFIDLISTLKPGDKVVFSVFRDRLLTISGTLGIIPGSTETEKITKSKEDVSSTRNNLFPKIYALLAHTYVIPSVAFSPDGKYIALSGDDKIVTLWEVAMGKKIKTFIIENSSQLASVGSISPLAFSPDGKFIVAGKNRWESGSGSALTLWEVGTGKKIKSFRGYTSERLFLSAFSATFSPDGRYVLAGNNDGTVRIWEINSGKEISIFKMHNNSVTSVAFSQDGKYALSGSWDKTIKLWDISKGENMLTFTGHTKAVSSVAFSPDGRYALSGSDDKTLKLWDINTGKEIKTFTGHLDAVKSVAFSPDGRYALSGSIDGTARIWNILTGKEILQFITFKDGEWIVITPEGYYNASPNGDKHLNVRIGNNVYGIENYREQFFRPDLVKLALAGYSLKDYKTLADVKQPPQVEIVDTPNEVRSDEVNVTIKLTDMGGGIGDVRIYLNETSILLDSVRGLKITPKPGEKTIYKTYTIRLLEGENIIKTVAFNAEGSMASNPAIHKVVSLLKSIKKPSIYAIVIGINEYKNPKLELKYAVADANLFAETLKVVATPLFDKVDIRLLTTKEETTKEHIKKTLEGFRRLNPDDVFVFYVASHGTVDEGEYFLITSNVGSVSTHRLKEDALTQAELKELIANVPTTKKMIIIDTCNAGKLGEALQTAMLTRGMSEDTAIKILSKAVGSTIISASTGLQEALEGYQGHGLFTYVLTEGLRGKADTDKDGFIKTLELANHVDSEVPVIAEKVFKRAQYPTAQPMGQAFPVGKVR